MKGEVWVDAYGYEGLYKISNYGRVSSKEKTVSKSNGSFCTYPERMLKQHPTPKRYMRVSLCKDGVERGFYVHRLVLLSFGIYPPTKNHVANHKNFDRSCNYLENLEWVTLQENYIHSKDRVKPINKRTLVPVIRVADNKIYHSVSQAGRENNLHPAEIWKSCSGLGFNKGKFKFVS